jgi:hypothetical protein
MITLETTDPMFMPLLKTYVPEYGHLHVKLVHKDGEAMNRTLAWAAGGKNIMVLGRRNKRYGHYPDWESFKSVVIPEKRTKSENERWMQAWEKVLARLEKSGLWEDIADNIRIALSVGMDKMKQAYHQYWEKYPDVPYEEHDRLNAEAIQKIDERLVGIRDDGSLYPHTELLWHMYYIPKVKKMRFGRKYLNDRKLAEIAEAMKNKQTIRVYADGRFINGYDVSFEYNPDANKAWYSEEYRGCGNGHYYLALDETHALFYEDD